MLKRFGQFGAAALLVAVAAAGCASEEKREDQASVDDTAQTVPREEMEAGEEQVLSEESQIIGEVPADIGTPSVEEGQTTVPVTRRITRTVITQHEIPTVDVSRTRVDVNRMDAEDFMAIGFSRQAAQNIVQAREERGQFQSVSELAQVEGVDQSLLSQLEPELGFSGVEGQARAETGDQMAQQPGQQDGQMAQQPQEGEQMGQQPEEAQPAE